MHRAPCAGLSVSADAAGVVLAGGLIYFRRVECTPIVEA
jgi:hypothetical protein